MQVNKTAPYLAQFNATLDTWISSLNGYAEETLLQKPEPDSWSLGQVYIHIIEDTRFFIGELIKALQTADNADKCMHADAAAIFEQGGFPDVRIANPAADQPRQPSDKNEILEGLILIKKEMNTLCGGRELADYKGKTEHPGLHYFDALEWLQFAEMHMRHHLRQKSRLDGQ